MEELSMSISQPASHRPGRAIPDQSVSAGRTPGMSRPAETLPTRVFWPYAISIWLVHALSLLALAPWFFSTSGLIVLVVTHFLFDGLGVSIGYHRLLTHRSFACPKWFEHLLAIFGICTLQDSPARWVAIHRMHHQHSDKPADPHSPWVTFFWGHMEWLLVKDRRHDSVFHFERYCRDLLRDPFYQKVERKLMWLWIYLAHAVAITAMGYAFGLYQEGTRQAAFQMAASWLVWGVFLRTVFTMHVTWAVNSVCHKWGYRNYQTRDESTNSWWVALLTFGEGWHNNHHADPRSARHGHRWFEFDMSWFLIRLFEKIGLASQVVGPRLRLGTIANEAIDEMPE